MKSRQLVLGVMCLFVVLPCRAQLTIEECYRKAQANYPLIRQYDLIEKSRAYHLANANRGYVPQIAFSAKASYQSDVTKLPFAPGQLDFLGVEIPVLSKDQYGVSVEVAQTIWDGGAIRAGKERIEAEAEVEKRHTEVSLYQINNRINQLYFGILLADAQLRQNVLYREELARRYRQVESCVENGVGNQADLDAVKITLLQAEQSRIQFEYTRRSYVEMLAQFIGEEIDPTTEFVRPAVVPVPAGIDRPELRWYDSQIKRLHAQDRSTQAGLMPKLGLFFTGGYGKPGLDMFENSFSPYYVAGVKLSWNVSNFYTRRNDKRRIDNDIRAVELQRETFLFNIDLDLAQKSNAMTRNVEQLRYDDEIIALRRSVCRASEAKMANGTLPGTDFMRDVTAVQMAQQEKIFHEIELLLSMYEMKFITNR